MPLLFLLAGSELYRAIGSVYRVIDAARQQTISFKKMVDGFVPTVLRRWFEALEPKTEPVVLTKNLSPAAQVRTAARYGQMATAAVW